MRNKFISLFVFAGVSTALLVPTMGFGQQRGTEQKGKGGDFQGKGAGGKGKGKTTMNVGGMNVDMSQMFDVLARGQDSVVISNVPGMSVQLQQWARDNGISGGVINRQQFNSFAQSYLSTLQGAAFGGAGGGGKAGKGGDPDTQAATRFKSGDKNRDGVMTPEEMSAQLRDSNIWRKFDRDGNGSLNEDEYKNYWREKTAADQALAFGGGKGKGNQGFNNNPLNTFEQEWEQRPTVYRVGKLPPGLPKWFQELDTDRDAQIGLYEWKPKNHTEFQIMDRNGDALLTAEEVLWHVKTIATAGKQSNTVASFAQASQTGFSNLDFGKGKGKKGGNNFDLGNFNFGGGGGGFGNKKGGTDTFGGFGGNNNNPKKGGGDAGKKGGGGKKGKGGGGGDF